MFKPQRLKIIIGGRGSGKSIGVADIFIMKMQTEKADILCLREHQKSIADSVHRTFEQSIRQRNGSKDGKLGGWSILGNKIVAPSGARTAYHGASRNPDSIQSAANYKYSWFEEAHRASQDSLDKLIPTILRIAGAQCWFTANPQSSNDPFSRRFINPYLKELEASGRYEDDLHLIIVLNWRDNPWWGPEQEEIRAWDYANIARAKYDWIWEGKFNDTVDNALIKPEWFDAAIDAHIKLGFEARGAIIAAHDPSDLGPDAKGFAARKGSVVLAVEELNRGDVNEGCDWALDRAINLGADYFTWDCDGLGAALSQQISLALSGKKIQRWMFKGSEMPDDPHVFFQRDDNPHESGSKTNKQTFLNKRAQYYTRLRDRFRNVFLAVEKHQYIDPEMMISLPSDLSCLSMLRSEVCSVPLKDNGAGMIQIMRKVEMKKMGISSPNLADSLMMTMVEGIDLLGFDDEYYTEAPSTYLSEIGENGY